MASLELSLSESLLLGFCVEEYRQSRSTLFEVFERRLRPFVPLLTQRKSIALERNDIPDDIEWYSLTRIDPIPEPPRENEVGESQSGKLKKFAAMPSPPQYHFLPATSTPFGDDAFFLGRARSCPRSAFIGNDCRDLGRPPGCPDEAMGKGKVVRIFWDASRRSLVELVIDNIYRTCGSVDSMLIERRAIGREQRWLWDFANFLDARYQMPVAPCDYDYLHEDLPWWVFCGCNDVAVYGLSDRLDAEPCETWDWQTACDAVETIVEQGGESGAFKAGRHFARLVGVSEKFDAAFNIVERCNEHVLYGPEVPFDSWFVEQEFSTTDVAHTELLQVIEGVLSLPVICRCQHARDILEHECAKRRRLGPPSGLGLCAEDSEYHLAPWWTDDIGLSFDTRHDYVAKWANAGASAWLAFGDVLATFRETDRATAGKDRPLPPLRTYQLMGNSSLDRVRAALQLTEQELADEANAGQIPEVVVACVVHGIEALTRRLWGNEFPANRDAKRGVVAVLDHKRKFGQSELEKRFAAVALSLYTAYRNPVAHDFDRFRCTWAETRFFVSGMRVLLDISERLAQQGGG